MSGLTRTFDCIRFVGVLCWSLFRCALLYELSSFAIILTRKTESWLLLLSFGCLVTVNVLWLFHMVPVGRSAVCDCGIS